MTVDFWSSRLGTALLAGLGSILLLWPAFHNGGPFWFPDTSTYIRGADAGFVVAFGTGSEWSGRLSTHAASAPPDSNPAAESKVKAGVTPVRPVLAGRSVYYGALIYVPMRFLGPWTAIFLQSLIVSSVLLFSLRNIWGGLDKAWSVRAELATFAILCALTPLPFYASMFMPDIFAGLTIVLVSILLVFGARLSKTEKIVASISVAIFATFHSTILLLAIFVTVAYVVLIPGKPAFRRVATFALPSITGAIAANAVFGVAVTSALGAPPLSPPFLSARLVADGPGTRYLRKACEEDTTSWRLCPHVSKFPIESDEFLWSESKGRSVFQSAAPVEQRQLAAEDKSLFLAVLRDDPVAVIANGLKNTVSILTQIRIVNFNYSRSNLAGFQTNLPPAIREQVLDSKAAAGAMPVGVQSIATLAVSFLAVGLMLYFVIANARDRAFLRSEKAMFAMLILAAVVFNAAVCGFFSSPTPRYQMRLIWILVIAACAILSQMASKHTHAHSSD